MSARTEWRAGEGGTGSGGQALELGKAEAGGLAGAGLGSGEHVFALENERNGLDLDRGGCRVTLFLYRMEAFGPKAELWERSGHKDLLGIGLLRLHAVKTGSGRCAVALTGSREFEEQPRGECGADRTKAPNLAGHCTRLEPGRDTFRERYRRGEVIASGESLPDENGTQADHQARREQQHSFSMTVPGGGMLGTRVQLELATAAQVARGDEQH